jgi:hypothetical protein
LSRILAAKLKKFVGIAISDGTSAYEARDSSGLKKGWLAEIVE